MKARKTVEPKERRRGTIEARGKGKWLVRIYLGTDPNTEKRKYSSRTVVGTRRDAERSLTEMLSQVDTGSFVEPSSHTVETYLREWLDGPIRQRVSSRTLMDHKDKLERYIFPAIGNRKLHQLTMKELEGLYASLRKDRGLSPNTIRLAHAPVRQGLKQAVRYGDLLKSPAEGIRLPKKGERKEFEVFDGRAVEHFLLVAEGDSLFPLWVLLVTTGLRPGEALALRWEDLQDRMLEVRHALTQTGPSTFEVGDPKTNKSKRRLTVPEYTLRLLREHRRKQAEEQLRGGKKYLRQDLIFADETGKHLNPQRVSSRWRALLKKHNLPPLRLYDLRHTHATLLFMNGHGAKAVSGRLGHSTITLTMDTYTRYLPEMDERIADSLDDMLTPMSRAG